MANPKGTRPQILNSDLLDDLKLYLKLTALIKNDQETQKQFIEVAIMNLVHEDFIDLKKKADKKGINLTPFLEELKVLSF